MAPPKEETENENSVDLFPECLQNWSWLSNLRKLELSNNRDVTTAAATRRPLKLCFLPPGDTSPFLTMHLRAWSLFSLHWALLDLADLFPNNIQNSLLQQIRDVTCSLVYQLPVVGTSLQKCLKQCPKLKWLTFLSTGVCWDRTECCLSGVHKLEDHVLMVEFPVSLMVYGAPLTTELLLLRGHLEICVCGGLLLTQWCGQER